MLPPHVNIEWIKNHLDNTCTGMSYMETLIYTNSSQKPNSPEAIFIRTIGSIKYKWDWISQDEKNRILLDLRCIIDCIKDPHTSEDLKKTHITDFRTNLTYRKWVLM